MTNNTGTGNAETGNNLASIIEGADDDTVALIFRGNEISYGTLRDTVGRLRGGLAAAGIGAGDRVMVSCGNSDTFVTAYLAIVGIGAVAVPINPASPAPELTRYIDAISPAAAFVGPMGLPHWANVEPSVRDSIPTFVTEPTEDLSAPTLIDELLAGDPVPVADVDPSDIAVMMFTSGTAGSPKAAMLTHANLMANLNNLAGVPDRVRSGDLVYGVLPLFHIFGLNVQLGGALHAGATILLVQRFDPLAAVESIVSRGVTVFGGVPTMWTAISQFEELPADSFATVRTATSGAARLPKSVATRMLENFGVDIAEGYGLTEASPVVTSSTGIPHKVGSVGKSVPGVEVRIADSDGDNAPLGDAGEIWVKGDIVFAGYLDDPEATRRVITDDGWLRTGDIGFCDEDGYLYLVDRAKDLIIVSGFNVFPAEVEEVLNAHPQVADAAVVGVPHPQQGEAIRAYVVTEEGQAVDEDTLIDHCRDHLARYKAPSKVLFVDHLPRNTSGKLVRRELEGTVLAES